MPQVMPFGSPRLPAVSLTYVLALYLSRQGEGPALFAGSTQAGRAPCTLLLTLPTLFPSFLSAGAMVWDA